MILFLGWTKLAILKIKNYGLQFWTDLKIKPTPGNTKKLQIMGGLSMFTSISSQALLGFTKSCQMKIIFFINIKLQISIMLNSPNITHTFLIGSLIMFIILFFKENPEFINTSQTELLMLNKINSSLLLKKLLKKYQKLEIY